MTKFMLLIFTLAFYGCNNSDSDSHAELTLKSLSSLQLQNALPGLATGMQKDDELTLTFAGNKIAGRNLPLNNESQFHLGSCTKAMTATLAGKLIEEGLLNWNTPLKDLLPDVSLHAGFEQATFEMLLSHRSGLISDGPETFANDWLFKALQSPLMNSAQARTLYAQTTLALAPRTVPGSKFTYSNGGYMIAAHILETLTGKNWEELIKEKLFAPLGMNHCGIGPSWGHYRNGTQIFPIFADNPLALAPAAGVFCTLSDWNKFLNEHLRGLKGENGIVSAQTFHKLHTVSANDGENYTFGGWIKVHKDWAHGMVLTHNGSNTWNYAQVWISPGQNTILMSTSNIGGSEAVKATDQAIMELIKAYL